MYWSNYLIIESCILNSNSIIIKTHNSYNTYIWYMKIKIMIKVFYFILFFFFFLLRIKLYHDNEKNKKIEEHQKCYP